MALIDFKEHCRERSEDDNLEFDEEFDELTQVCTTTVSWIPPFYHENTCCDLGTMVTMTYEGPQLFTKYLLGVCCICEHETIGQY